MRIEAQNTHFNSDPLNDLMENVAFRRGGQSNHNNKNSNQNFSNGNGNSDNGGRRGRGRGGRNSGRGNRPLCQVCGKLGHVVVKCFHRFDMSFQGQQQNNNQPSQSNGNPQAFIGASNDGPSSQEWYLDSGATNHITSELNNLSIHNDYTGAEKLTVGNGSKLPILHIWNTTLKLENPKTQLNLRNILHVPKITKNLLSISQFTQDINILIEFLCDKWFIKEKTTQIVLLEATVKDGLDQLDLSQLSSHLADATSFCV